MQTKLTFWNVVGTPVSFRSFSTFPRYTVNSLKIERANMDGSARTALVSFGANKVVVVVVGKTLFSPTSNFATLSF